MPYDELYFSFPGTIFLPWPLFHRSNCTWVIFYWFSDKQQQSHYCFSLVSESRKTCAILGFLILGLFQAEKCLQKGGKKQSFKLFHKKIGLFDVFFSGADFSSKKCNLLSLKKYISTAFWFYRRMILIWRNKCLKLLALSLDILSLLIN